MKTNIEKLTDISARLDSLEGLCFTLAHAHSVPEADKQLAGAFFAIGNIVEAEQKAVEEVLRSLLRGRQEAG